MDFKITEEKENKVMERKEILFEVKDTKVTPSRKEIKKRLAALKNTKEELVSIAKINQVYGARKSTGTAFIYADIETLKKTEPGFLEARDGKKKDKEKKEKPAEKPAESEKPKEKKEEPKEEEKKE